MPERLAALLLSLLPLLGAASTGNAHPLARWPLLVAAPSSSTQEPYGPPRLPVQHLTSPSIPPATSIMPTRSPQPCIIPGCPNPKTTTTSRCATHQKAARHQQDRQRGTAHQRGYDQQHRQWRTLILQRDPTCRNCHSRPSTIADHITPISQGGARFDLDNGQGLCKSCHDHKTATQDGAFGRPGVPPVNQPTPGTEEGCGFSR